MNKHYLLITENLPGSDKPGRRKLQAIAFARDYHRLDYYIHELEAELADKGLKGPVIFDLLLSKGHTANRYVMAEFGGIQFDVKSLSADTEPYSKILLSTLSAVILKEHSAELDLSLLSKPLQHAVKSGMALHPS